MLLGLAAIAASQPVGEPVAPVSSVTDDSSKSADVKSVLMYYLYLFQDKKSFYFL